ncbi:MAG: hypothetical protein J7647_23005 [Cyanobacteria bacterium SBLK]|nr:hypothetical protein [Cyanobacteria bacterium SBLK]
MNILLTFGLGVGMVLLGFMRSSLALPPPEDIPEEVLRNEIILEARSPIDGEPLTAAEYARLQEELSQPQAFVDLDPTVEQIVFLLRLRQTLNTLIPFLNL